MAYFDNFPYVAYQFPDNVIRTYKNIALRPAIVQDVLEQQANFELYSIQEGETPETIAYDIFGDVNLHWFIMLSNNIMNLYTDWPRTTEQFDEYLYEKYKMQKDSDGRDVELTRSQVREFVDFKGTTTNNFTSNIVLEADQIIKGVLPVGDGKRFLNPEIVFPETDKTERVVGNLGLATSHFSQNVKDEVEEIILFGLNHYFNNFLDSESIRVIEDFDSIAFYTYDSDSESMFDGVAAQYCCAAADQDDIFIKTDFIDSEEGITTDSDYRLLFHEVIHISQYLIGYMLDSDSVPYRERRQEVQAYDEQANFYNAYLKFKDTGKTVHEYFPYEIINTKADAADSDIITVIINIYPHHFEDANKMEYTYETVIADSDLEDAFGRSVVLPSVTPVSIYEYEEELNEAKRQIKILKPEAARKALEQLRDLLNG